MITTQATRASEPFRNLGAMASAGSAKASAEREQIPSELLGPVPRDVRLTGPGIAVVIVAILMAMGALATAIFMSVAYTRGEEVRQLREGEGVTVQAEVVGVVLRRGEHPRRVVTYAYEADGTRYTGRTTLRQSDRRDIARGTIVPVGYVSSDPETSWMIGYEPDAFPIWLIPLVSIALLVGAAAIAWSVRRQRMLLSEGRVAQARITGHKKIHRDKHKAYRVTYEFRTLSGATQTARYEMGKTPPPIGTLIPIVYHRDKPQWSAAYPLQLVRPARTQARRF